MSEPSSSEIIIIPKRAVVHEHPESRAKYTVFPFVFPDGTPGQCIILKGTRSPWIPSKDTRKIEITFEDA